MTPPSWWRSPTRRLRERLEAGRHGHGLTRAAGENLAAKPAAQLRRRAESQGEKPLLLRELVLGPEVGIVRSPEAVDGFRKVLWHSVAAIIALMAAAAALVVFVAWALSLDAEVHSLAGKAVHLATTRSGLAAVGVLACSATLRFAVRRRSLRQDRG